MNQHYTYLLIDLLTISFPLIFSFDKKVAFYQTWRYLWRGMLVTGVFFIVWDILFNNSGIWSFNDKYIVGVRIFGLPIEEWLFFIVVPYACTFIYASLLAYTSIEKKRDHGWSVLLPLGILLIVAGIVFADRTYTLCSFLFCGLALIIVFFFRDKIPAFRADAFSYTFLFSIVPFLIVNGFLTALPVVSYDNNENLALRIYTIPVEDLFYGMLLILGNVISLPSRAERNAIAKLS